MVTRLEGQKKPFIQLPATPYEWKQLAAKALAQAEKVRDPRAVGLRVALEAGKIEKNLRLMGIVCPADIIRIFPER